MYVSIDIETLGLNSDYCDVIEFGAVIDDLKTPVDQLPQFHCYVLPPRRHSGNNSPRYYQGEPFAMAMHAEKLKRIANREKGFSYDESNIVGPAFADWLVEHGFEGDSYKKMECCHLSSLQPVKIVVAGKNFSNFDAKFLAKLDDFENCIAYHHRMFDPNALYFNPKTDTLPPSLEECLKRAGYKDSTVKHHAVDDALDVIRVLRHKWAVPCF